MNRTFVQAVAEAAEARALPPTAPPQSLSGVGFLLGRFLMRLVD